MGSIETRRFGEAGGRDVSLYTLTNANGVTARITDYGGILVGLDAPDRDGNLADVTLGFDDFASYLGRHPYFGALVGRFANRIGNARFELDGERYAVAANDGPNHLHGGLAGFDKRIWNAETAESAEGARLTLRYVSAGGEEGYPGELSVSAVYTLADDNSLTLSFTAVTDKPTIVNLVNHAYWNLAGAGGGGIGDHRLKLFAERYTPMGPGNIPTGEIAEVAGTPYDFRDEKPIVRDEGALPDGYDMNFAVDGAAGTLRPAAEVYEPESGRVLTVLTDAPGVQFYTAFKLDGSLTGKGGKAYGSRAGLCLETQTFPDSPNKPNFPSPVLRPGETYRHTLVWRFSAR